MEEQRSIRANRQVSKKEEWENMKHRRREGRDQERENNDIREDQNKITDDEYSFPGQGVGLGFLLSGRLLAFYRGGLRQRQAD